MQDDVANAEENPYPGQLFNKPTDSGTPGVDVYKARLTNLYLAVARVDSNLSCGRVASQLTPATK